MDNKQQATDERQEAREYVPTFKRVCTFEGCKGFGKPLVDRGYGYPVCETVVWSDEFVFNLQPRIPMQSKYFDEVKT